MFFVTTGKATVAFTGVKIAGQDFRVRFGSDMQKYMATIDVASSAECGMTNTGAAFVFKMTTIYVLHNVKFTCMPDQSDDHADETNVVSAEDLLQ